MITKCAACGKRTVVLYPDLWVYKRGSKFNYKYLCSWSCLRAYDKEKGEIDMSFTQVKKDGTPAKKPGRKPAKKQIETPEGEFVTVATKVPPKTIAGGDWEKMETPEGAKIGGLCPPVAYQDEITAWEGGKPVDRITLPVRFDGMTVREVEGDFGRYRYTAVAGAEYIDYECPEGLDTISLSVEQWKNFRAEQEKAARALGVEL